MNLMKKQDILVFIDKFKDKNMFIDKISIIPPRKSLGKYVEMFKISLYTVQD